MILTVTLNPLLERRLVYKNAELGKGNRCEEEYFYSGGKGINVSRQLNKLGIKNHAFTFLGGNNGKVLRHCFVNDQIDFTVVSTKAETRLADVIIEKANNRISTFFGLNSIVTQQEADEFKIKLEKMIQNCSIVVFSGSSPCQETNDIFPVGIRLAHEFDKISILDTYGEHLQACIEESPTIMHNNILEIENSFGINLQPENSKLDFLKQLYQKGIKLSFLSDGENPAYAAKFDYTYKIDSPNISVVDETGSGDAFVAGLAYGMEQSMVFDEFAKLASALGTANAAMLETCQVTKAEAEKYRDEIKIITLGKKMKLIDDSPHY